MNAALLAMLLLAPPAVPTGVPAAPEGPNPFLAQAKELYGALNFEKCLQRLAQAPQWRSSPTELKQIELYAGLCHFNLAHRSEAQEHFRLALRIDENAELPEFSSPKAMELFAAVKRSLRAPPPPMPDADLPADAPVEPKPVATLAPAPVAAQREPAAPPTGDRAPLWQTHAAPFALGAVSAASLTVGIALGLHANALAVEAKHATFESDYLALATAAHHNALGANIAYALAAAALVAAVVVLLVDR